ncbi:MAG: PLP-dependent aminotransferase family protein [Oscillospiraceae bacterium]|nr:PLP-dependent aminotransferase family protein [Oscillospiraceae bacterium]
MLTYTLSSDDSCPLYEQLCGFLRRDILSGRLPSGARLPSKRSLSGNLGVSSITVESAYNRLIDEGYVRSEPKRGYYVSELSGRDCRPPEAPAVSIRLPEVYDAPLDLSGNRTPAARFPFSVWAHLMRETINEHGEALLHPSPCGGVRPLREAIAAHLRSFRGMSVDPDQIIVGAGTEYLYGLLIQLLGKDRVYCLEDPGYRKIAQIYASNGACCRWAAMDDLGISIAGLEAAGADVVHISPTHHFPTGITMPVSRRYELLSWASALPGRTIIEDDYDSEFRLTGRPIPSLQSIDTDGCVIYMNTFSKTLASTIRISYMILPPVLANRYYSQLSFYSCTVSSFEQYCLARFLSGGWFEKHLNRMRLFYARLRRELLQVIADSPCADRLTVLERDSGLHFLLQIRTALSDTLLLERLRERGISLVPLSAYYRNAQDAPDHTFILNYSSLSAADLARALRFLSDLI